MWGSLLVYNGSPFGKFFFDHRFCLMGIVKKYMESIIVLEFRKNPVYSIACPLPTAALIHLGEGCPSLSRPSADGFDRLHRLYHTFYHGHVDMSVDALIMYAN